MHRLNLLADECLWFGDWGNMTPFIIYIYIYVQPIIHILHTYMCLILDVYKYIFHIHIWTEKYPPRCFSRCPSPCCSNWSLWAVHAVAAGAPCAGCKLLAFFCKNNISNHLYYQSMNSRTLIIPDFVPFSFNHTRRFEPNLKGPSFTSFTLPKESGRSLFWP